MPLLIRELEKLRQQVASLTYTIHSGGGGGVGTSTLTVTTISPTQINTSWTPVTGATGYILERAASVSFTSPTTLYSGTELSFNDTGLTQNTQYYYRVKATFSTTSPIKNTTTASVVVSNNTFPFTFPFNFS